MPDEVVRNGVIIAENDHLMRGILRTMLEERFTVFLAADGVEAVSFATRLVASAVVLDLKMPKLDGFNACAEIRSLPGYSAVPIVILTAHDNEETRATAKRVGATEFYAKPFRAVDLMRNILRLTGTTLPDDNRAPAVPAPHVWPRRQEPPPAFGDPPELSEGRRVLNIYRR